MNEEQQAHEILDDYYNKIEEWSAHLLRIRKELVQGTNPVILADQFDEIRQEYYQYLNNKYQEVVNFCEDKEDSEMGLALSRKVHFMGMEQVIFRSNLMNTHEFIRSLSNKESRFN